MSVGLVIVSHSAQLARGVVELASQMVQGKVVMAPAGGAEDDRTGTSATKIMQAIQQTEGPDGVLILLDLGSALLSTEMALELLDETQRPRVQITYAPLVEGAVTAALEAALGHSLEQVRQAAEKTAQAGQLRLLKPVEQEEPAATTPPPVTPTSKEAPEYASATPTREVSTFITLNNPTGLHARPASLLVQMAARFQANIHVTKGDRQADAKSIMEVLSLGARQHDTITVQASGSEADAALQALRELVEHDFYETPHKPAPPVQQAQPPLEPITSPASHEPWHGISTSKGVAVGPAFVYTSGIRDLKTISVQQITSGQIAEQQSALRSSLDQVAQDLSVLAENVQHTIGQEEAGIFEAQIMMLQDPALLDSALELIASQRIDAASALAQAGEQQAALLEQVGDELFAQRATDVRDVVSRTVTLLRDQNAPASDLSILQRPVILVARDLTPSDTAKLRPEAVLGICTTQGGPTAHAAILARALGIPAIAGLSEAALESVHTGDDLALDATQGLLYHQPDEQTRAHLTQQVALQQQQRIASQQAAGKAQPILTINERRIRFYANIGSEAEAEAARQWGAEGVGLLRTEFLFGDATTLPGENEQRQRYARIFQTFKGSRAQAPGPIIARTLDAGADKPMPALESAIGKMTEMNPALGLRGVRIHLAHQDLLQQQLRALLLAAADTQIELHIMFPMITTVEELRTARAIFERVHAEVRQQQSSVPERVPLGIMVEVPSAALMARELAQIADFFSIGANDLTQYILASDRTNASVASLYNPMQPAVLRLIKQTAEAGQQAGKLVAVCGEMAGDPRLAPLLVGLGVDELSMAPIALPAVQEILRRKPARDIMQLAARILSLQTLEEVEQACTEFAR